MADAAARRDARRRRILENSHSRLQLISGKCSDECVKEPTSRTTIPEPEYEIADIAADPSFIKSPQHNGAVYSESEMLDFLSSGHETAAGDAEAMSDLAPLVPPPPPPPPEPAVTLTLWEKCVLHKYDMVLLSILIQILYGMSIITFESGYFFLPVIVYIVTKMIWFPSQNNSGIANVLMLLNGMTPDRVRTILFLTQCVTTVTRDTFVYLFTTICIQSVWVTLSGCMGT